MGTSTDAILAYGYDLGTEEWNIHEVDEYGGPNIPWFDNEAHNADFAEAVERQLLAAAGFTETDWSADGYFQRQRQALASWGVELVAHCHIDSPGYILAGHHVNAWRGDPQTVDLTELAGLQQAADERLARALAALGFTPVQEAPAWFLASYWA